MESFFRGSFSWNEHWRFIAHKMAEKWAIATDSIAHNFIYVSLEGEWIYYHGSIKGW